MSRITILLKTIALICLAISISACKPTKIINSQENEPPGWYNTGFEDGTLGLWEAVSEDFKTEVSSVDKHTGGHSLHISERKSKYQTVRQKVRLKQGRTYDFSVWLKSGDQSFNSSLFLLMENEGTYEEVAIAKTSVTKEGWTRLQGSYFFQTINKPGNIYLYISADHPETDFFMDDFRINLAE